ncbi:flotillin-like protein FloA [Rhabdochlamydiaceae symbiont of Dictyostelium giganteum]|uniref:flotillin-like protein FloA n=1 Tax=Rhabdochlamydiaceae symbiont of Dictyostelium giganteum TaxID=3342349 RepID=UPI00384EB40B
MNENPAPDLYFLVFIAIIIGGMLVITISRYIGLWFQALVSGTPVSLTNIIGMSLRKIPSRNIVNAYINVYKAGVRDVSVADLETHFLAGGNISNVVRAIIAAEKASISLTWRQATAIDLAGRDILDAVRTSVNPKVIDCPDEKHGEYITAVAKDGVQVKCRARVTVRTSIQQLVGGATEETIVARVGEAIVNSIGGSLTHTDVLGAPHRISHLALEKGLDAGTAFEILSIDIADISIGENIGAKLRADQAESDKRIAQAKAEERRAMAVAMEQENTAKVTAAEAEVPLAIAEAFRKGNLGLMDFYRLKNIQADTSMRNAFSEDTPHEES